MSQLDDIKRQAHRAAVQLLELARLMPGQIVVVGCSSSEILGQSIGSHSSPEVGKAVFDALHQVFAEAGVHLAAQCCEHLNRAIIIEREAAGALDIVSVVPRPTAGGSFASAAYESLRDPVAVEEIRADAGLDIGGTLIGMHLKRVAVPLRLDTQRIGDAAVNAARTRPRLIGGTRAEYDDRLL